MKISIASKGCTDRSSSLISAFVFSGCFYALVVDDCSDSRSKSKFCDDLNESFRGKLFEIIRSVGIQAVVDDVVPQNQLSFSFDVPVSAKNAFELLMGICSTRI